ncbi:MAG: cytochrome C [Helicobacteraceae bacterium]|nr:cytochrome C [Helicobacteraceae bacterium]
MKIITLLLLATIAFAEPKNSCIECHKGIEDIRDKDSGMMKAIYDMAEMAGVKGNDCVVCHGGNPSASKKDLAHSSSLKFFLENEGPKEFYPSPSSPWINENSCGVCHPEQVGAQHNSLMQTEQGKIQGALWSFGAMNGYKHDIGTYDTNNSTDPHTRLGTQKYRSYMNKLSELEPNVFPKQMRQLPQAPTAEEVEKDPTLAVYTYLRQDCLRCHTGSKGRKAFGDYRGVGCASCHIPYSNSGLYEGADKSIDKKEAGHLLVHSIQSSRKAKVKVGDVEYSGIPVETCSTCHNRGKRIGVSYQGLMETEYNAPYDEKGNAQKKLHTKRYLHMKEDIHYSKGMLCQDCHTSNDMHGDGFLGGTTLAAVEIECQDCHGTTSKYPWELPLGYSDEFNTTAKTGKPRGVAQDVAKYLKKGHVPEKKDGYLLTARGNPLHKAVRKGDKIIMHLASGKNITLTPLKKLKEEKKISKKGLIAMDQISAHTDKLECYTCHATWAPQCYGCHVKIDYSKGQQNVDYLKASHDHDIHGATGDMKKDLREYLVDGKVTETRSFLRWEDPALSQNGEGRVSPTVPGCQTTITVIGKDGNALLQNHIFKIPNVEGAGEEGQLAIDMSPIQPHTIQKEARECESCHTNPKALGYGIGNNKLMADPSKPTIIDLMSADGKPIPKIYNTQIQAIPNLKMEYSKFVDENGTQRQTVGHHWKLSQPLTNLQRSIIDREGVCISCHQSIPRGDIAMSLISFMAEKSGIVIDNNFHKSLLHRLLLESAWLEVLGGVFVGLFILYKILQRRKDKKRWK